MLTLIAESKTMTLCDTPISADTYAAHTPTLETYADNIMASLGDMSATELATAVKISQTMARRLVEMVYDFGNKTSGAAAIEAFTGVVFRALSYKTLDSSAQRHICGKVRIISSLRLVEARRHRKGVPPRLRYAAGTTRQQDIQIILATIRHRVPAAIYRAKRLS